MQKALQDFVKSLGLSFTISLDKQPGKFHYVEDGDFKGCYIFKEIKFGNDISLWVTVYNYKTRETHQFRHESRAFNEDEQIKIEKARQELEKKLEAEKERLNQEARIYATKQWALYDFGTKHEYFTKKQVEAPDKTFKVRISEMDKSAELLCPMVDADGLFWGYQIISEVRGKDYLLNQKTDGIFIPLGLHDQPKRIYICEGVATALSVFMGSGGQPTVAANSAQNVPKVAKALRKKYPKTPFVIMADNDRWGTTGNAGLQVAYLAQQETDGIVVESPTFPDEAINKPTDWNDYHVLYGIEALTQILDAIKTSRPEHFWALGHARGQYFFTNLRAPEIHSTKDFSETDMLKILSLPKWESLYPQYVNFKGKLEWGYVRSELIDACQKKGHFLLTESRGLGMYMEKGKTLVHLGDRVLFDGQEIELQDFESEHFYDLKFRRALPDRNAEYKPKEFIKKLRDMLGGYTWENRMAPELLIGWLYCAYASGAIPWRPHLLVSAKAGSGKSKILELVVEELLKYSGVLTKDDTSEAGLRQDLENNAVPVLHDEFDTNKGEAKRMASVLNLLRAASSGGSISRGTPSGKSLRFEARFCAYLTGINPPVLNEADQSRITQLRLIKQNPRKWSELEKEIELLISDGAARGIFWQVVDTLPAFQESARTLQAALSHHGERVGQQYGALLAGFWQMFHVEQISKEQAEMYANNVQIAQNDSGEELNKENNAEKCVEHLLDMRVRVTGAENYEATLGQLLESPFTANDPLERELGAVGIKRLDAKTLFIAGNQAALTSWFERTQWPNYSEALLRLPDAKRDRHRVGGKAPRGVTLSLPS